MNKKKIFIILFAILYLSVAFVSTLHAISFFGLANNSFMSVILAITFEIGQAAVLFSILTNNGGKNKFIPWFLMIILTLVQIMGNVFSSYKYLLTNSEDMLKYFKEPIFIWTELPDAQANVIVSYLVGAILPIVALLLTSMVTNYINPEDKEEEIEDDTESIDEEDEPADELIDKPIIEEELPKEAPESTEMPVIDNETPQEVVSIPEEKITQQDENKRPSHFINI